MGEAPATASALSRGYSFQAPGVGMGGLSLRYVQLNPGGWGLGLNNHSENVDPRNSDPGQRRSKRINLPVVLVTVLQSSTSMVRLFFNKRLNPAMSAVQN